MNNVMKRFLFVLFCCSMLLACVPTPEAEIVVAKGNDVDEISKELPDFPDRITGECSFTVSGAPKAMDYSGAFSVDDLKEYVVPTEVIVDASVVVPDVSAFPRYAVQPGQCSDETVREFLSACEPFDAWRIGCSNEGITQENLKRQMQYYATLIDDGSPLWDIIRVDTRTYDADDVAYAKEALTKRIQSLQSSLTEALSSLDGERIGDRSFSGRMQFFSETDNVAPNSVLLSFGGVTDEIIYREGSVLGYPALQMNNPTSRLYRYAKMQPSISQDEARRYADAFVAKIRSADFRLADSGTDFLINPELPFTEWMFSGVYAFLYVPVIDGIPLSYADLPYMENVLNWTNTHPDVQFQEVHPCSGLFVYVDDEGVVSAIWQSAASYRIVETLNPSPKLMPLDAIMGRFYQQISYGESFCVSNRISPEPLPKSQKLTIDRITLGYALVHSKSLASEYELLPVWDFYGYVEEQYTTNPGYMVTSDLIRHETQTGRVYLTLNAIDGSVVNRIVGY